MNKTIEVWIDVDYWMVRDESDNQLFRGSRTACKNYAAKHGGIVGHVILEKEERTAEEFIKLRDALFDTLQRLPSPKYRNDWPARNARLRLENKIMSINGVLKDLEQQGVQM